MNFNKIASNLEILLDLDRELVGVKVVKTIEEYNQYEGKDIVSPISYCVAVKSASLGHAIKITRDTSGCGGGSRSLGFISPDEEFFTGKSGCGLGLYKDEEVAAKVAHEVENLSSDTYGVIIKPLIKFEEKPDVILIVSNTREAMRVLQGYTYENGLTKGFKLSGNQAVCVEATSFPMNTKELNISMFCSGTRHKAHWGTDEVIIGLPIEKAESLVRGLKGTVNAIEYNDRKEKIQEGLKDNDSLDFDIDYSKTYFSTWENQNAK